MKTNKLGDFVLKLQEIFTNAGVEVDPQRRCIGGIVSANNSISAHFLSKKHYGFGRNLNPTYTLTVRYLPTKYSKTFFEHKDGSFKWDDIAEAVASCAKAQAELDKNHAKLIAKQVSYLFYCRTLIEEFGLDNYYGPVQVHPTTTGMQVCFESCMTLEQAKALLETAKKVGLLKWPTAKET